MLSLVQKEGFWYYPDGSPLRCADSVYFTNGMKFGQIHCWAAMRGQKGCSLHVEPFAQNQTQIARFILTITHVFLPETEYPNFRFKPMEPSTRERHGTVADSRKTE